MTDWVAASLWLHGPIATLSLAGIITLSGKSALGHVPAEKSRKLAKTLFSQMGAELQKRMEVALNNYEVSSGYVHRDVHRIVTPGEPEDHIPTRKTIILGAGAEAIRNELSDFLLDGSRAMIDWRILREIGKGLTDICSQLRVLCMLTLAVSVFGLLAGGVGRFYDASAAVLVCAQIFVAVTVVCVAGVLLCLFRMVRQRNRLAPLEDRYDDLLA
ncbi:MAG: hypothetical protein JJU33_06730 [Phycisphaerales bacterium]|nr:hypothetical protein [Phycisphaerales bacterium]